MKRKALLGVCLAALLVAASVPAGAQVEIRVRTAPPIARVETIPPPPSPSHYWIAGNWAWEQGAWAWRGGHWEASRRDEVWVRAHWARAGDEWVFRPGHWARIVAPREVVEVVTEKAPPPPRVEVVTAAPSSEHFWVPGHWRWEGGAHVWVGGHWELSRPGQVWVPAHWVFFEHRWHLRGGHWQAT